VPFAFTIDNPCAGEPVDIEGLSTMFFTSRKMQTVGSTARPTLTSRGKA
jgi:hypothetical protein